MRTVQDTCSGTLTIWCGLDKIRVATLCYNLMRSRQDTFNRNYDWNRILIRLQSKRQQKLRPSDRAKSKTNIPILLNIHIAVDAYLVFQVLMEYKDSPKVFTKTINWSYLARVQIHPWGPIQYYPFGVGIICLILAHSVYKIWIIQDPNKLELWNKLHFKEKKRRVHTMFKIFGTYICWINI